MMRPKDLVRLPDHVAIIMDGNGRWARRRGLPRIMGHRQGVKSVRTIVRAARELGIRVLTLYAFSQENWNRPAEEVGALMDLFAEYLDSELQALLGNLISLRVMGEEARIPERVRIKLRKVVEKTSQNREMILNLAVSYGSRHELVRAARLISERCLAGELRPDEIDEKVFSAHLFTAGLPDPDLLIRTSGEFRLSNFLLYQAAYAELYVTSTLWPDFDRGEFLDALYEYQRRERRFGLTGEQITENVQ